ncbi:MAG TPA: Ppx/GppA phosphatase family protein [Coriobacteriia bacterium]|nr:Ppx/GppA phosphatase family protein [Coriobacteriia bacterium]
MGDARRIAAIDIGTVTTRLLVADVSSHEIHEVERSTDITHLGTGLGAAGSLSPEAMKRVADVIGCYADRMKALGVEHYVAMATSASRDADNGAEFRHMLSERGIDTTIIAGSREAELSFLGATFERPGDGLLVVDCGGGSTELVLGDVEIDDDARRSNIVSARSIDVGSRRMTELFLHSDPPSRSELEEARTWAAAEMRSYFDRLDRRPRQMIGLAGTATTLAAIRLELAVYDPVKVHGYALSGSEISDILDLLAGLPLERRMQVTGLHPERAGVIVAGALILETALALAGLDTMIVSEHDILYGILLDTYRHLR